MAVGMNREKLRGYGEKLLMRNESCVAVLGIVYQGVGLYSKGRMV